MTNDDWRGCWTKYFENRELKKDSEIHGVDKVLEIEGPIYIFPKKKIETGGK